MFTYFKGLGNLPIFIILSVHEESVFGAMHFLMYLDCYHGKESWIIYKNYDFAGALRLDSFKAIRFLAHLLCMLIANIQLRKC